MRDVKILSNVIKETKVIKFCLLQCKSALQPSDDPSPGLHGELWGSVVEDTVVGVILSWSRSQCCRGRGGVCAQ